jgi:hypothetical protein
MQFDLKQQQQALRPVAIVKEKQDMKLQVLQKEKQKIQAETATKDWEPGLQFLQPRVILEKELNELNTML